MFAPIPLFPDRASALAEQVDNLFFFLCGVTGAVALLVTVLLLYFSIRYRRRIEGGQTPRILGSLGLETFWSVVPLLIFLGMFVWGAAVYSTVLHPPPDAPEIY